VAERRTYVYIPLGYSELSPKDMSDEPFWSVSHACGDLRERRILRAHRGTCLDIRRTVGYSRRVWPKTVLSKQMPISTSGHCLDMGTWWLCSTVWRIIERPRGWPPRWSAVS